MLCMLTLYWNLCASNPKLMISIALSSRISWRALGGIFHRWRKNSGTDTSSSGAVVHDSNGVAGERFR
jgi:hypothetical protein